MAKATRAQKEAMKKYYRDNIEKEKLRRKIYREKNPDGERERSRRKRENNKDKYNKMAEKWRRSHLEWFAEYWRKRRAEDPEKYKEYRRQHHEEHKEHDNLLTRIYRKANRGKCNMWDRNRYARERNAPGTHDDWDVFVIWTKQRHKCAVPGCSHPISDKGENRYHVDHIKAIKNGGGNDKSNLQILCSHHNKGKRDADEIEWAKKHHVKLNTLNNQPRR